MKRIEIIADFIKKSVFPITIARILYNGLFQHCIQYGAVNYMYLLMRCGIPFGTSFMFTLSIFIGNIGVWISMSCFNVCNRYADRRHCPDMGIACRRMLCACYGG